ncbi:MAG: resE8 [Clostridia bacterium]|nr:resE8 [Clostridia bacterium]
MIYDILICLVLCVLTFIAGFWLGKNKSKSENKKLCDTLEALLRGDFTVDLSRFKEGEHSILAGQLELVILRTNSMLERLKKEKQNMVDYIADISHQLKTPLTGLITYLELIKNTENNSNKTVQLESCIFLAEKINALVRALLVMARFDSGAMTLNISEGDIISTAELAAETIKTAFSEKRLNIKITPRCPIYARYDKSWLSQALENILKNAAEYSSTGNSQNNTEINIVITQSETMTTIIISDNGGGIDENDLPHIFERFYSVKKGRSERLGIGLSLSQKIINAHHGSLHAANGKKGAEFTISLPNFALINKTED